MIVMGAGTNHWFHSDQTYRAMLALVLFCGCQGLNGGGWAHYVGQEKVRPITGWMTVAFALDWSRPPRQQPATPFWYLATDQWRYETFGAEEFTSPAGNGSLGGRHLADCHALAARLGWLASYPSFDRNPLDLCDEARERGLDPAAYAVEELRARRLRFACEDPDDPANFPRALAMAREPARLLGKGTSTSSVTCSASPTPPCARASPRPSSAPGGRVARRGAGGQARPVHDDRLPHERLVRVLRRRLAGGDLVREARPLEHRPPPVRPSVQRCDPAAVGDEDGLGGVQPDRRRVQPPRPRPPRHALGPGRRSAASRHPRGAGPASGPGTRLEGRASASRCRGGRCRSWRPSSATTRRGREDDGARAAGREGGDRRQGRGLEAEPRGRRARCRNGRANGGGPASGARPCAATRTSARRSWRSRGRPTGGSRSRVPGARGARPGSSSPRYPRSAPTSGSPSASSTSSRAR